MRRRTLAIVAVGAALAAVGWWATRPPPPSDEAQVRALLDEGARAASERRAADAVAGLSERFQGQGLDRQGVKRMVAATTLGGAWVMVRVAGARVEVAGEAARAEVDLVLSRGGTGGGVAALLPAEGSTWRVDARLAREPEGWRVVAATWRPISLGEALGAPPETPGGDGR